LPVLQSIQNSLSTRLELDYVYNFSGLSPSDNALLELLLSKNPNSTIRGQVSLFGGYEECDPDHYESVKETLKCPDGFVLNPNNSYCYNIAPFEGDFKYGKSVCHNLEAEIISFTNDDDTSGFITLVKSGINQ
jgi:hypothetical protein